jgi:predicted RND superfamily exporter protein
MPIGSHETRQSIFLGLEGICRRNPRRVFLATAIVLVVGAWLGTRVRLDTDILALVPEGDRAVDAFKASLKEFGGVDFIQVMIEAPAGHTADEYEEFVDRFSERVAKLDGVQNVESRLGGSEELFALFRQYALMFLPPEEIPRLRDKLSDAAIEEQVREDRQALLNPSSLFLKQLVENDPLGLGPMLWGHLLKGKGALKINPTNGYYMSEDGTALLVLVKPTRPAQDLGFTAKLVAALKAAEAASRREMLDEGAGPSINDMKVEYAGSYVIALEDSNLIKSDMKITAIFSFFGVLGLYLVGYRRVGALLYSSVPLLVGQTLTFAVAYLVLGRLNSASSGFVAMVMGLGTDFTIVMYARYVEERRQGATLDEASQQMMGEGALGMFTGAITSAGTFYSMCVTRFRGLWELGFLIGTGILLSMVAILFLLPAMIQWNEGRRRRKDVLQKLYVQSFGFEHLLPVAGRHPGWTLTALGALTGLLGVAAWNVGFSDSIRDLRSPSNRGSIAQDKVIQKFGGDLNLMMAIVQAGTPEAALDEVRAVVERAQPFIDLGILRGTDSLASYLPPASRQRAVLDALARGSGGDFSADRIERSFRRALSD